MYEGKRYRPEPEQNPTPAPKKKSGKKLVVLLASLALALGVSVGGTIAFLTTNTDPVQNTFQPTEVTCEVKETFEDNVKSNVTIQNTSDIDAYIRAEIIVNWVDASGNIFGEPVDAADYELVLKSGTKWIEGKDGYYYHTSKVSPEAHTDILIERCVMKATATKPADNAQLSVTILSSAIQAEPDRADDSWDNNLVNVTGSNGTLSVAEQTNNQQGG